MMSFTLQSNGASASGVNSNASFFPFPFFLPSSWPLLPHGTRQMEHVKEASVSARCARL